ncbi:MAG TPA: hypothetical protein PKD53_06755 [Chloroflexaceae bacterium]|nr:hypothetical protein [Chloroflexaceae bacterium]
MKTERRHLVLGLVAVAAGALWLLANLGVYQIPDLFGGALAALGGAAFLGVYFRNRERWWAIIPGVILLAMGAVIFLAVNGQEEWAGVLTLGGVGLAFVGVLLARRDFWWAVIPAGALLSLSALVYAEEVLGVAEPAAVLFLGLGATFGLLALVRVGERRMRWPLFPAAFLGLFGALFLVGRPDLINLFWPVALILGGLYYALRGRGAGGPPVAHAP